MRHRLSRLRLKQKPAHGRMMERNLLTSVLLYESIRTTKKRAKVIQPRIDSIISQAKKNAPHIAIRAINRVVTDKNASRKIMEVYCERYKNRESGLSRIIPAGVRKGDGAEIVDLVLVDAVLDGYDGSTKTDNKKSKTSKKDADKTSNDKKKTSVEKKETKTPNKKSTSKKESK